MVGAIERIENELAGIKEAIAQLAAECYSTYENYLNVLGQATRQQLIVASYHLCTQTYPEQFVKLSFSQRQKLQQDIRKLGDSGTEKLQKLLQEKRKKRRSAEELLSIFSVNREELKNLDLEGSETQEEERETSTIEFDASEIFPDATNSQLPIQLQIEIHQIENLDSSEITEEDKEGEASEVKIETPEDLANWLENIENGIPQTIKYLSQQGNVLMQRSGIFPEKLPPQVLEAASQIESNEAPVAGLPNLLNLAIETQSQEESKTVSVTRVTAINLRFSEIEFADAQLTALRGEIRSLSGRLNQLGRDYNKKQRKLAVIQAESAWRASWYDE